MSAIAKFQEMNVWIKNLEVMGAMPQMMQDGTIEVRDYYHMNGKVAGFDIVKLTTARQAAKFIVERE